MRARKLLPVESVPLVGGSLSVDFVNTTGARAAARQRERLQSYSDVVTWGRRVGLLTPTEAKRLKAIASADPGAARRAVARLQKVRERLYRVLRATADGTRPKKDDVAALDQLARRERQRYQLTLASHHFELRRQEDKEELDGIMWPVVASAVALLTAPDVGRLKRCGECDWLFVDDSKNRSRQWCKKECGDRVRARRHYARHKNPSA